MTISKLTGIKVIEPVLVVFLALLSFVLFEDYGITFDEPRQQEYSEMVLRFYESKGEDRSAFSHFNMRYYGAAFELLCAVANRYSPFGVYETRHLLNALTGSLGVWGTYRLAMLLSGSTTAGLVAALLLVLTPSWFGHMFNNPKDIPFATGYVWSLYFLLRLCGSLPGFAISSASGLALSLGLTLGVRIGGVLLVFTAGLVLLLYVIKPDLFKSPREVSTMPSAKSRLITVVVGGGGVLLVAYLVMLVCWPWALTSPIVHPLEAIQKMSGFDDWPGTILLAGEYVDARNLPRSYIFQYFSVKLPETLLLAGLLAPVIVFMLWKKGARPSPLLATRIGVTLFSMIFPLAVAILKRSALYDGIRHFLFIIPLLWVLLAAVYSAFWIQTNSRMVKKLVIYALILSGGLQLSAVVRLHPHQYVYYNHFAGGLQGADRRFELDYWANSYREAVKRLEQFVLKRDGAIALNNKYRVFIDGPYLSATYYLPDHFEHVRSPEEADFGITHTRWELDLKMPGRRVDAVTREGVDLAVIKEMHRDSVAE